MSKFINTSHKMTINSLTESIKEKLKNPYYIHNDKNATIVEYFNQNTTKSTLDVASKQAYSLVGDKSPIRYNLIEDAYLYGFNTVTLTREIGEFGIEDTAIEGEVVCLPGTFIPMAGDFFKVKHITQNLLFKVLKVSIDTLEDGSNLYSLEYKIDRYNDDSIYDQVVDKYKFIVNNVGTNYKSIVRSVDYDIIENIDEYLSTLRTYFKELFYVDKLDTFIYCENMHYIYDPYMIEFIKNNKLLYSNKSDYMSINHAALIPNTFSLSYNKSIFKAIERRKMNDNIVVSYYADGVIDPNSLLSVRSDIYYMVKPITNSIFQSVLQTIDPIILDYIKDNTKFDKSNNLYIWNTLISYMNNEEMTDELLSYIKEYEYDFLQDKNHFYLLPILIYILEHYIISLLT